MKKYLILILLFSQSIKAQDTAITAKSGKWTLPATWKENKLPKNGNYISSRHTLTIDTSISISGLNAENLIIDGKKNLTINTTGSLIIKNFTWKSAMAQTIVFDSINESLVRGGGMDIPNTDVGLWITGTSTIQGTKKTPWTNLRKPVAAGDSILSVVNGSGWKTGDRLVVTATNGDYRAFDTVTIKSTSTTTIRLTSSLIYSHPATYNPFTKKYLYAEVLNLTRNLKITGKPNARAHIIFLMAGKQTISYLEAAYMAPRKNKEEILGRYGFHFHHCENGSIGSVIRGVVVSNCGSNGFVPHASNGILLEDDIVWGAMVNGYWWDFPDSTMDNSSDNVTFNRCVAGYIRGETMNTYSLSGFVLGVGRGNKTTNCIVTSNYGSSGSAGYLWPSKANYKPNTWIYQNNLTHDVRENGLRVWENDSSNHIVKGFTGYDCGESGMSVGAYHQNYQFDSIYLINNKYSIQLHANAIPEGTKDKNGFILSFTNVKATDSLYLAPHTLINEGATGFVTCIFPGIIVAEFPRRNPSAAGYYDFINCSLPPERFKIYGMEDESEIRVQDNGKAFQIKGGVTTLIIPFF